MPTKKRRPRGEGSIYFHEALQLWACAIPLDKDADGKRRRRVLYAKTRPELQRKVFDARARGGGSIRPRVEGTLREWVDGWLADEVKPNRSSATWVSYEGVWRIHVEPTIGSVALEDLGVDHGLGMTRKLRAKGVSTSMIARYCRVMHRAMAVAIRHGRVDRRGAGCSQPRRSTGSRALVAAAHRRLTPGRGARPQMVRYRLRAADDFRAPFPF
jgi:hypothetical protein